MSGRWWLIDIESVGGVLLVGWLLFSVLYMIFSIVDGLRGKK